MKIIGIAFDDKMEIITNVKVNNDYSLTVTLEDLNTGRIRQEVRL